MIKYINNFINRGQDRSVKAKKNILGMLFLKGFSILLSLIIVPITISYVSKYQYGIWLTVSSLVAWLSFFDIGLGSGLKNKFIEFVSAGKKELAKTYVSTTYAILAIIMGCVWVVTCIVNPFIGWSHVLNVPQEMNDELVIVMFIIVTNFCFQFVLRIMTTLINALQRPALASLFDTLSQFIAAIIIIFLINFTDGSLIYLALAMGGSNLLILLVGNYWIFSHDLKEYKPHFKYVDFAVSKDIMSLGVKFFFLQIISILCYQTNNIIISNMLGPSEVTVYNVAYKYMYVIAMIYSIILAPFWSGFTEAKTIGDYTWMKNVTRRLRNMFLLIGILGGFMVLVSPICYKYWVGKEDVSVPMSITLLMFIYHMTNLWGTLHTQLLAGFGKIKLQLIFSAICGIIVIPISIVLCRWLGLQGIIIGNIFVFVLFGSWFGYIQVNRLLEKRAKGIWNE